MNGTVPFVAVVAVFIAALAVVVLLNRPGRKRVIGRRATLGELLAAIPEPARLPELPAQPVHLVPPAEGEFVTPCCGRDPLSLCEPLTFSAGDVTCTGGGPDAP